MESMRTPGECHRMLCMSIEILQDLHDLLVQRYGLESSRHMNTTEMLAMFICIHVVAMSQTGKLKIGLSTQERPLVGNLMRSLTL